MKRLLFLSALLAGLTLCASCSNDDDKLSLEMTAADLEQTAWDAHEITYDGQGSIVGERFYILEFITDETGKLTEMNTDGDYSSTWDFSYTVDRKLIGFQGALTWSCMVTERTKNKIVMQTFRANKVVITLKRKY